MATYRVTGPDGAVYEIDGPPGATNEQVIAEVKRQLAPPPEEDIFSRYKYEPDAIDQIEEFFKGIPRDLLGLVGTGALGAAAALPEEYETPTRDVIQSITELMQSPFAPDPGEEGLLGGKLGGALGSTVLPLALSYLGPAGMAAAGVLSVGASAGTASERARAAGATEEERTMSAASAAPVGLLEMVPIKLFRNLGETAATTIQNRIGRALEAGGVEGAQEAATEVAQNLIAQNIYDPEQGAFTNTGESFGLGAGAGVLIQGLMDLVIRDRSRGAGTQRGAGTPTTGEEITGETTTGETTTGETTTGETAAVEPEVVEPSVEEAAAARRAERQSGVLEREMQRQRDALDAVAEQRAFEATNRAANRQLGDEQGDLFPTDLIAALEQPAPRQDVTEEQAVALMAADAQRREMEEAAEAETIAQRESQIGIDEVIAADQEAELVRVAAEEQRMADDAELQRMLDEENTAAETAIFERDSIRQASDIETLSNRLVDEREQRYFNNRRAVLDDVISSSDLQGADVNQVISAYEQSLADQNFGRPQALPAEASTIQRAVNVANAVQPAPEVIPQDPEAAQNVAMEAVIPERRAPQPEQPTLPGVEGRQGAERRGLQAPQRLDVEEAEAQAFPEPVTTIDDTFMDRMGIAPGATFRNMLMGRDMRTPEDRDYVRNQVERFIPRLPKKSPTVGRLNNFLRNLDGMAYGDAQQLEMFGPRGGVIKPERPEPKKAEPKEPEPKEPEPKEPEPKKTEPKEPEPKEPEPKEPEPKKAEPKEPEPKEPEPKKAEPEPKKAEPKEPEPKEPEPKKAEPKEPEPKPKVARTAKERASTKPAEANEDSAKAEALIKSPKRAREEAAPKAARTYFTGDNGNVDASLRRMAFDDVNNLSQKAASEETNPVVKRRLEGTSGPTARAAITWARANLSKEANAKLDAFIKDAEKFKKLNDPASIEAQIESRDAAILKQRQTKEALSKKTETEAGSGKAQARLRKKQKDAILADEQFANDMLEVLEDSEVLGGIDDIGTLLFLESDGMLPFVVPVSPVAEGFLDTGDVKSALDTLAAQSADPVVKRIAKKLAENIGDAKVKFVDSDTIGGRPGAYDPKTNTILLNNDAVVTNHTLMHEAAHAVTQRVLRNKSHPLTRQVTSLFDRVKGRMDEMGEYGAKNIDDFVSEYFSNPMFRNELATIFDKQSDMSVLQRMAKSIGDFLKRIFGLPPRLTQEYIDDLMMGLMAPSMANRNASEIYLAPETVGEYFNNNFRNQTAESNRKEALIDASKEFASDGWKQSKKLVLGALPLPSLVDLGKRYLPKAFNNFQDLTNRYASAIQGINESLGNGSIKAVDDWVKQHPDNYADLKRVLYDGTLAEIDFRKGRSAYFDNSNKLKAYDGLKSSWDNLSENGGQAVYRKIRTTYDRLYKELIDQIKGDVTALGGSEKLGTALRNEFYKKLVENGGLEGYFPLTRQQGEHFLQYSYVDPSSGTQDVIQIFKSEKERDRFAAQLLAGNNTVVEGTVKTKDKVTKSMFDQYPTSSFLGGVMQILNANNADPQMIEQIMRMAIEVSPQNSIAKMMRGREGYLGFDENVLETFRTSTLRIARRSAQIRFNAELGKLSREMDEEANLILEEGSEDSQQVKLYRNELVERIKIARNPDIPWAVNLAKTVTYGFTLGFNASSAIIDMAAIPMILYPMLKGKYRSGDVVKTMNSAVKLFMGSPSKHSIESYTTRGLEGDELKAALKELGLKGRDVEDRNAMKSLANYDFESPDLPAELQKYKELVDVMREQGQIQRFSPLDDIETFGEGQILAKVNAYQGFMMQMSERFRREVTQASAYDLALQQMQKDGRTIDAAARREAALEAVRLSELTNGSTSSLAGPRYAQTALGALPFMYKRYGISMMYLQFSQLRAVLSKETDPEIRKQAMTQFGLTMGMSAIFSGARGMPLMGAAALLYNMFKDDEDDDFDTMMRSSFLSTLGTEGIINYFTGANVAKRIALTDMMFRSDPGNEKNTPAEILWTHLAGPTGGTIDRVYRGATQISEGNFWRGTESLLPSAVANLMKSWRFGIEGSRTTKGDVILDDIGPSGIIGQALGFAPAENARRQEFITLRKYSEKKVQKRRSQLFDRAWMARKQGDFDGLQEVMEDIRKFNDSVSDPKMKILPKNLERSAATRKSQDLKRVFGVVPGNYQAWRQKAVEVLGEDALE